MRQIILYNLCLILIFLSCNGSHQEENQAIEKKDSSNLKITDSSRNITFTHFLDRTKKYEPVLIGKIEHEPGSFTQGLIYHKGYLYESTGLRGESSLRKLDTGTGKVIKKVPVAPEHFAEGITIFNNKIYQLTWMSNLCFVYDSETFDMEGSFNFYGEGWGLTAFNNLLIMSDGSNVLKYIKHDDFQIVRQVSVFDGNTPIKNLNELELINGELFANIWTEDRIIRIDPTNGNVIGELDFSFLRKFINNANADVFNGIAYNPEKDVYYVTGKYWDYIFIVKLVEKHSK
jgi:glutamine cyclotransferase